MTEPVNPLVVDLSHWNTAPDFAAVKSGGIVGVIHKGTQGTGYHDDTFPERRREARAAGLKWGAYHFGEGASVEAQAENFINFACPEPDELFALDWEDNPNGSTMTADQAKEWITCVEDALERPGECVIYTGNTCKEALGDSCDEFFGGRRLWHAQYGSAPEIQDSWSAYWLWQYTDGEHGPSPHAVDGIGPCDINSYDGTAAALAAEWAGGQPQPAPDLRGATVNLQIKGPVTVSVNGEVVYPR